MGIKAWWRRTFGKDRDVIRDEEKIAAYALAGGEMGSAVSYIYLGECIGFDKLLDHWELTERDYAALGFRTISIDDFVSFGGWGGNIDAKLRVPRKEGEDAVFHAAYYREHFLQKMTPAVDFNRMMNDGRPQCSTYEVPSTEHLRSK